MSENLDKVQKTKPSAIIATKQEPCAKLIPVEQKKQSLFGKMKGTVRIKGDITQPIEEKWEAYS